MSLHLLKFNKNNITFKRSSKRALPPTCDTIVKNLINNPKHHLGLINKTNDSNTFDKTAFQRSLKIKKLGSLLTKGFSVEIPQKSYKGKPSQLISLLKEADNLSTHIDGSYIMQPIVVEAKTYNENNKDWKLISGQQRITTIYMILKYLESNKPQINTCKTSTDLLNQHFLNTVSYKSWDNYLQNKQGEHNPLNHELSKMYQVLHDWFSKKTYVEQEIWKKKLLNHTKFIWYKSEKESYESEKVVNIGGVGFENKYLS